MESVWDRGYQLGVRLLIAAISGVIVFIASIVMVGTFLPIGFGCLYYGGLTMLAAASCSRYEFVIVAVGIPFLLVDWGNAIEHGILILIGSKIACLISQMLSPDDTGISSIGQPNDLK